MAKVLAEKKYHYQFVFARNAGHCDGAVKQQTLAEALEYVWQDGAKASAMFRRDFAEAFQRAVSDESR